MTTVLGHNLVGERTMRISLWKRSIARPRKRRALTRLLTVSALIAFGAVGLSASASASHSPVSTTLWGYEAGTASRILEYDIGPADAFVSSCTPAGSLNGRGLAFDPTDGNLWYTFVDGAFAGDGFIHKTTPPPACAPVTTIPFRDGPGGTVQDDIGAIDVDPDDANLWVAGYHPIGGESFLYKVDRTTGALIDFCHVPFGGGGEGNDTLTEAKLSGLPGSGSYLLTDAGEIVTAPNDLLVVDERRAQGVVRHRRRHVPEGRGHDGYRLRDEAHRHRRALDLRPRQRSVRCCAGNHVGDAEQHSRGHHVAGQSGPAGEPDPHARLGHEPVGQTSTASPRRSPMGSGFPCPE